MGRTRGTAPPSVKRQRSVITDRFKKNEEQEEAEPQSVRVSNTHVVSRSGGKRKRGAVTSQPHSSLAEAATAAAAELLGEDPEAEFINPSVLDELAQVLDGTASNNPQEPGAHLEAETSQFWTEPAVVVEPPKIEEEVPFFLKPHEFDLNFASEFDLHPGAVDCLAAAAAAAGLGVSVDTTNPPAPPPPAAAAAAAPPPAAAATAARAAAPATAPAPAPATAPDPSVQPGLHLLATVAEQVNKGKKGTPRKRKGKSETTQEVTAGVTAGGGGLSSKEKQVRKPRSKKSGSAGKLNRASSLTLDVTSGAAAGAAAGGGGADAAAGVGGGGGAALSTLNGERRTSLREIWSGSVRPYHHT